MSAVDRSDLIEDIEWLIECGETHPEAIARRVGWDGRSLSRVLRKVGRPDLANWVGRTWGPA